MLTLRLLAALIPTTAVLVAPPAAHAERLTIEDAVADAQTIRSDFDEEVFTPAPEHTAADITRTVVMNGARRLQVRVLFRDLERTFPSAAYVKVRTPGWRFDIQTSRNALEADIQLTRRQRRDLVECRGLRSRVDGAEDQLTISVPSACIGNPAWVQVGVLSLLAEVDANFESEEPFSLYFDDANTTGGFEDQDARLGPRVITG
ncbi:hypothetical protein GCM10023339_34640 [Alloalcanivorax gelatiniphagus]